MDTRRRQVEEVEGLQAVFGPAFEIANETQFAQLQSVLDGNDDCGDLVGIQIGFALIVSVCIGCVRAPGLHLFPLTI